MFQDSKVPQQRIQMDGTKNKIGRVRNKVVASAQQQQPPRGGDDGDVVDLK